MIDNKNIFLIDELKKNISKNSNIYIQCKQFTFLALAEFILGLEDFNQVKVLVEYDKNTLDGWSGINDDYRIRSDFKSILKAINLSDLTDKKIQFKKGFCGFDCFIIENKDSNLIFIYTFNKWNTQVLGLTPSLSPLFVIKLEEADEYLTLFKQTFQHANDFNEIKEYLTLNVNLSIPKKQYLYTLDHLFKDYERLENFENFEQTGFFKSKVWNLLYNFQQDAVLGAIDKIEKYGGCIIADSVGLGKTFEALAIIKYYQNRNKSVLVLSPKRLYENWNVYRNNDRRNILSEDRLNYDLLFHTDLSREKGESNGIDLENYVWENMDLIVIDESHNFRNNNPSKNHKSRYQRLMQDIIKKGVKTKVLMLSATPVNNRLKDLKNQLYFITEEDDKGFSNTGITSIEQVLRKSQKDFNDWLKKPSRKREDLINNLDGRYFKLLDMLTIARSRKHIQKYYDMASIGTFPNRLPPINLPTDFDTEDDFPNIGNINEDIIRLNMAQYMPTKYIMPNKITFYSDKYDHKVKAGTVLTQMNREEGLTGLMRVNFLKRLESSIYSFRLTMDRVQYNLTNLISKIENYHDKSEGFIEQGDIDLEEDIDSLSPDLFIGNNVKVLLQDMDLIRFKQDLQFDLEIIKSIISHAKKISVDRDKKLIELKEIILNKVKNPINKGNKKVLIFSAFADTATYLYNNISEWAKENLGIYSGLVTGGVNSNKTNLPNCKNDFNDIIIHFSPKSKLRKSENEKEAEIDILIGTDCISEGQNLQDCDYLINYDIHWNPVRIVQRFGRIDRIGSSNTDIQLVNFWPNIDLNTYISLVEKVKGRMTILDVSATGDEDIINTDVTGGELSYRKKQMEKLQSQVLDLEDLQDDSISISDFTFNDFKVDLEHLTPKDKEELGKIIPGFVGVAENKKIAESGVIFCLKHTNEKESELYMTNNPLYPFCLLFISHDGEVIYNVKQCKNTLDILRSSSMISSNNEQDLKNDFIIKLKNKSTKDHLERLWKIGIESIRGNTDLSVINSVFTPGETITPITSPGQEFALVNYFVINGVTDN